MKFLIYLIFFSFIFSQDEVCLPKDDFDFLAKELRQLEVSDSLKTIEIEKLNVLLNQYIELCQDIDREDLIKIDKQLLQEEITTNELHMKNLISKIEEVVMGN